MRSTIQLIDCYPSAGIQRHMVEKIEKMEERFTWISEGKIIFRRNKNDRKKNKIVEIRFSIPGKRIFAEAAAENFRLASDNVLTAIQQQLSKHKTIITKHHVEQASL